MGRSGIIEGILCILLAVGLATLQWLAPAASVSAETAFGSSAQAIAVVAPAAVEARREDPGCPG